MSLVNEVCRLVPIETRIKGPHRDRVRFTDCEIDPAGQWATLYVDINRYPAGIVGLELGQRDVLRYETFVEDHPRLSDQTKHTLIELGMRFLIKKTGAHF